MTDPHADLRAMLEALPSMDVPALVRALLSERDVLAGQLTYLGIERDALRAERDTLWAEIERLRKSKPADLDAADAAWRERLLAFEEHRMRCMMAATLAGGFLSDPNILKVDAKGITDGVDSLIAEARRRKEAGK